MTYELIRKQMSTVVPFNTFLGVKILEIGDGTALCSLPLQKTLLNHIKTAHASAIFGLSEAASGAAMSGAFAPVILDIRPVAGQASISYLKTAKTDLTALARTQDKTDELRRRLQAEGKAAFDVEVLVQDAEGNDIANMMVKWHVSKKR